MPSFKYIIELSEQERIELLDIVTKGISCARKILRANILLASDKRSDKYMTVAEIAETYHTTPTTVQTVRASYCEKGLEATINRKKRETPPVPAKVTGEIEAHIIALACSDPPEGYSKWTLRLLADKTVELGYISSISHVTVSSVLRSPLKTTGYHLSTSSACIFSVIFAQISLDGRQPACTQFVQSDKKSDCASEALWFLEVTLKKMNLSLT